MGQLIRIKDLYSVCRADLQGIYVSQGELVRKQQSSIVIIKKETLLNCAQFLQSQNIWNMKFSGLQEHDQSI